MKKIVMLFLIFTLFIALPVFGQEPMPSSGGGGGGHAVPIPITTPSVWFSYWPSNGIYNLQFGVDNVESFYKIVPFVNGVRKGAITPQKTKVHKQDPDDSSKLVDLKQVYGKVEIYEPGEYNITVFTCIAKKRCFKNEIIIEVPVFDFWVYRIDNLGHVGLVKIGYIISPIFTDIVKGDLIDIYVNDKLLMTSPVEINEYGQLQVALYVDYIIYDDIAGYSSTTLKIVKTGDEANQQIYYDPSVITTPSIPGGGGG